MAGNYVGENRKAGETPARARHCDWGVLQHGVSQSLSFRGRTGRRWREVLNLTLAANAATLGRVKLVLDDVLAATRCHSHRLEERDDIEDGAFEVSDTEFAPKPG